MKFSFLFIALLSTLTLFGNTTILDQDEVAILEELIVASRKNLNAQEELLKRVIRFKKMREAFVEEPTNARLATQLVKNAMLVHRLMEEEHLTYLFSSEFLTEIHFFNQVGVQKKPTS